MTLHVVHSLESMFFYWDQRRDALVHNLSTTKRQTTEDKTEKQEDTKKSNKDQDTNEKLNIWEVNEPIDYEFSLIHFG